jgi:hypothetical protein
LRVAQEGALGVFDSTLKVHALGALLSLVQSDGVVAPEALSILRAGVLTCTPDELAQLRLTGYCVTPGDEAAAAWALDAQPRLQSPRSPARRPITFVNLRDTPVDIIWIGFDGEQRRYTRAQDNVESRVRIAAAGCSQKLNRVSFCC